MQKKKATGSIKLILCSQFSILIRSAPIKEITDYLFFTCPFLSETFLSRSGYIIESGVIMCYFHSHRCRMYELDGCSCYSRLFRKNQHQQHRKKRKFLVAALMLKFTDQNDKLFSSNKVIFISDSEFQERDKVTVGTMTIMVKK